MDSKVSYIKKEMEKLKPIKSKNRFIKIKSDYFIQKIFNNMSKKVTLKILKNNMNMQKRLNINIINYKDFSEKFTSIELEIIPFKDEYGSFIKLNEENKKYFHIYFNDNKKEVKKTEINKEDNVSKINIIINYQIKSFKLLFFYCTCIESIGFKKFYRTDITDMSGMFCRCLTLKELNLSNFNTNNVIDMCGMFNGCSSLTKLNLSNFNTNNVIDMSFMFQHCSSLKEINISSFNTNNVTNMNNMFFECSSLKELDLSNFNTNKVTSMSNMFGRCSEELKLKIRSKYKNFQEISFDDN